MANLNANVNPVLFITPDNQVMAQTPQGTAVSLSSTGFAIDIGISTDGTVWAVSMTPDTDSGGSLLYWSTGDGNWNAIDNSAPGALQVTGSGPGACYYLTADDEVWYMNTEGTNELLFSGSNVLELDYGGEYTWAVFPTTPGGDPCLQYNSLQAVPFTWKPFNPAVQPTDISVSYGGDCYGIVNNSPIFFSHDGSTTGSAGAGADGICECITFKNSCYVLTTQINNDGNTVMIWEDVNGGQFANAGFDAVTVLSTYYLASA